MNIETHHQALVIQYSIPTLEVHRPSRPRPKKWTLKLARKKKEADLPMDRALELAQCEQAVTPTQTRTYDLPV